MLALGLLERDAIDYNTRLTEYQLLVYMNSRVCNLSSGFHQADELSGYLPFRERRILLSIFYGPSKILVKDLIQRRNEIDEKEKTIAKNTIPPIMHSLPDTSVTATRTLTGQIFSHVIQHQTKEIDITESVYIGASYFKFIKQDQKLLSILQSLTGNNIHEQERCQIISNIYFKGYNQLKALFYFLPNDISSVQDSNRSFYLEYIFSRNNIQNDRIDYQLKQLYWLDAYNQYRIPALYSASALAAYLLYVVNPKSEKLTFYTYIQFYQNNDTPPKIKFRCCIDMCLNILEQDKVKYFRIFVVSIDIQYLAEATLLDTAEKEIIHAVSIVIPYDVAKKYRLHDNAVRYDRRFIVDLLHKLVRDGASAFGFERHPNTIYVMLS